MKISTLKLLFVIVFLLLTRFAFAVCTTTPSIEVVKYMGKVGASDQIGISFRLSPSGTNDGGTCVRISGVAFNITITRKNGHQDSGTVTVDTTTGGIDSPRNAIITIPRGVLETDPVSYALHMNAASRLTMKFPSINTTRSASGQVQSTEENFDCCPKLDINSLLLQSSSNGIDHILVSSKLTISNQCLITTGSATYTITVTHQSGQSCIGSKAVPPTNLDTVVDVPCVDSTPVTGTTGKLVINLQPNVTGIAPSLNPSKTGQF